MKGKHKIEVRSKRIVFTIELERNITILCGDSATGKTTLVEMLTPMRTMVEKAALRLSVIKCAESCLVHSGKLN